MKEINYGVFRILGERAEEAAKVLDQELRNLDYIYSAAPSDAGYSEARTELFNKIREDFGVKIV